MPTQLLEMLEFMRPAFSVYEEAFIDRYLRSIPDIQEDPFGNLHLDIGESPNVIWSSHTDTVHFKSGFQLVRHNRRTNTATLAQGSKSSCLGADCTTGVWLMMEMIKANRPGRYIFHRAEECGGQGSNYIRDNTPELLSGINIAIAFDRYGISEVITHQVGGRTASTVFAQSLADELGLGLKPSGDGVFTDTAVYRKIIPECTNIAVGYYKHHTASERQDLDFALRLRDSLLDLDTSKLIIARDPTANPEYPTSSWHPRWTSRQQTIRAYADYIDDLLFDLGVNDTSLQQYIDARTALAA